MEYLDRLNGIVQPKIDLGPGDLAHIVRSYDAEVRGMDEAFGALISYLREKNVYQDTVIVFTSDHGEEFNEHGAIGRHADTLHDELLRVPLLIKPPGESLRGKRIGRQVRGLDIMPTLLEMVDIVIPENVEGVSLLPLIHSGEFEERLMAISRRDLPAGVDETSVRSDSWRYIRWAGFGYLTGEEDVRREYLYDLRKDPGELQDLSRAERETAEFFSQLVKRTGFHQEKADQVLLSKEVRDRLSELGYLREE